MFEEFQKEVLDAYRNMKDRHELPSELENLTRAKLRRYSLMILANKYDRKDDEAIRQFFDSENRYSDHEERIKRFDLDKFRPLINFLNGETRNTDERNVKFLAWLIDFEPRPYAMWKKIRSGNDDDMANEEDIKGTSGIGSDEVQNVEKETGEDTSPMPPKSPPPRPRKHRGCQLILYICIAVLMSVGGFFLAGKFREKPCMYWSNDRYVAVNCREKITGVEIIAKDDNLLKHFRKITQPDTLTVQHANTVWYSKINNRVEFFTSPGFHPIYGDKSLKAATKHIIEQYAQEKNVEVER